MNTVFETYAKNRFSKDQAGYVLNQRRAWNANEQAMAKRFGPEMLGNRATAIGNAQPLPKDVWGEWDRDSVYIQRDMLAVYADLAASVSRAMNIGKLIHYFRTSSMSPTANVSLDGRGKGKTDQQVYDYHGTPLPIIDVPFSYGWRQMAAAMTEGEPLESDGRWDAERAVAEKLEDIVLNGDSSIVVGGDPLYGLRNHPNRGSRNTTNDLSTCTGAQWEADVKATLVLLNNDNHFGAATLYVNMTDWLYASRTEYTANYPRKISEVILSMAGVANVVPSSKVPADNIIAVVKQPNVVRLLVGMPMATIPLFRANPHDDYNFVTMAASALEIKFDADERCGVATSIPA